MHCKWSPLQGISHLLDKIFYPLRLCWLIFIIDFLFSSLWNNLNSLYFYRYIGQTNRPGGWLPDAWRELRNTGYSRFSCHKTWIYVFSVELQSSQLLPPRPNPLWMAAVVVWCAFAGECWGVQELEHSSRFSWKKHQQWWLKPSLNSRVIRSTLILICNKIFPCFFSSKNQKY